MRLSAAFFAALILALPSNAQERHEALLIRCKEVLSPHSGKLPFRNLREPVEVIRDQWGIPHIYAKNQYDLFFAQGIVVAQDRLFQIDWWRRVGNGETAEVLGASAIEADRFARLLRYRGDMEKEWTSYSPDTKEIATAFTDGINAWIDQLGDKLPIEFQILKYTPKRWRPEDILGRMSGIIMSRNMEQELARALLIAEVGMEKARLLAPTDPIVEVTVAKDLDLSALDPKLFAAYKAAAKAPAFQPSKFESNNWAVDGQLSASGRPMLASDPHRTIALPSLRYLVHLNAPGWNVIGAGEPALPGVALGHNDHIAWGITIVGTDQSDLYVEKTNPADANQYLTEAGWEAMKVVHEEIAVKGQAQKSKVMLRFTRHGPVIGSDEHRKIAVALKWAGSEPGGAAYLAGLAVSRAKNHSEFLHALKGWKIPSLNFMYADTTGQIAWVAAAATPVRKNHHGLVPVPGWTGTYEWERFLSVDELPQQVNPSSHWLATANHNILPKGYSHEIGYEFAPPHRFQRIQEVLAGAKKMTLEDFERLQHDAVSIPGRQLGKRLAATPNLSESATPFAQRFARWDGHLSKDSPEGLLYAAWLREMTNELYLRPKTKTPERLRTLNNIAHLLHELEHPSESYFGPQPSVQRDAFVRSTFEKAIEATKKIAGNDSKDWRWGRVHQVDFRHALSKAGNGFSSLFDLPSVERTGDGNTPNNTRYDEKYRQIHGASYRHVFDLADWDRGRATSTPGQSGQPGSPHYGDLLPLWAEEKYFPMTFSRSKVEQVARNRLRLEPAEK